MVPVPIGVGDVIAIGSLIAKIVSTLKKVCICDRTFIALGFMQSVVQDRSASVFKQFNFYRTVK